MQKIGTKELFDAYFSTMSEERVKKTRAQADRKEVYEYEKKIGKQLMDMNIDELIDLILTFENNSKSNPGGVLSFGSYDSIATNYRALWNFYIDNYEVIKNPWYDKRLRGMEIAKKITQVREPFTKKKFDKLIIDMHEKFHEKKANYLECLMLLYYNGVYNAREIAFLTERDIDKRNKSLNLSGRRIRLDDRCFELLMEIKLYQSMPNHRGELYFATWRDHYFPYIIRPKELEDFDNRSEEEACNMLNRRLIMDVNRNTKENVNYKVFYMLGLYDSMVEHFGKERTKELILASRDTKATKDLMDFVILKDCPIDNVTLLKRQLRAFVGK